MNSILKPIATVGSLRLIITIYLSIDINYSDFVLIEMEFSDYLIGL